MKKFGLRTVSVFVCERPGQPLAAVQRNSLFGAGAPTRLLRIPTVDRVLSKAQLLPGLTIGTPIQARLDSPAYHVAQRAQQKAWILNQGNVQPLELCEWATLPRQMPDWYGLPHHWRTGRDFAGTTTSPAARRIWLTPLSRKTRSQAPAPHPTSTTLFGWTSSSSSGTVTCVAASALRRFLS